jgi:hypothetical protein
MKRLQVEKAFSVANKYLLIEGDEVYAEKGVSVYTVYSPKTRKPLGTIFNEKFEAHTKDFVEKVS